MVINGEDPTGTALVLAVAPVGKGRLTDAVSVLPALAAVPPSALTGTAAANLVELADPLDPQAVLTRLRAAVATPGTLSVYIAGQLHLDHKQRLPHLALARSTPSTLRYTALPWHWLAAELKLRRPGTTTVVVDLVAEAEAWQQLTADRAVLALGYGVRLYGRIAPPPARRTMAAPDYLKACAALWRSGARPPLAALHQQAAEQAAAQAVEHARTRGGALLLSVDAPVVVPGPLPQRTPTPLDRPAAGQAPPAADPHPAILAAAHAGRHAEATAAASAWEHEAVRAHGPGSPQAIHWLEVRADLARLAQDPGGSCELWMAVAHARLERQQTVDDPDVEGAVDRAHHQWEQLRDAARARALAPALIALRRRVPGRQRGAVQALQRRLERWHTAGTPGRAAAVPSQATAVPSRTTAQAPAARPPAPVAAPRPAVGPPAPR
ncbi:hypothetical protein [Streptomyces sp. SP18CS02]|uniref:hypothetical protein n=1 Tax=Streptomyces sp. SP18CS02 TaxID=3002531 RepID=UPI002E76D984|nr:hypothetical protein [Streptomyces sp. SP18CS02]MEE1756438.1 hypothetical protein [Streptomyces sp. SP18CS02]